MSLNIKQRYNHRNVQTAPLKKKELPIGGVSPDDPIGVTSEPGQTGQPPPLLPEA